MDAEPIKTHQIQDFIDSHPEFYFCAGIIVPPRPGVRLTIVRMEYETYPPDTPLNDNFFVFIMHWKEMTWVLIAFPKGDLDKLVSIATECGTKVVRGIPTMFSAEGIDQFPVTSEHLFHLENVSGHLVYDNDFGIFSDLYEQESIAVEEIINKTKIMH